MKFLKVLKFYENFDFFLIKFYVKGTPDSYEERI
jgi:hypothetical protein